MTSENTSPRHPITWVPTLYLAEGLPYYAIALIAGYLYQDMGVSNSENTFWTGLIGFAWVFKCLWSPFLEAANSKKFLIILFQFIGGTCLGLVALSLQLPIFFAVSIALLGLVAIASATHDIAADGLYIASLNNKQQATYVGWQGAFYNAGKFISSGGLVILAGYLKDTMPPAQAWAVIFGILASLMITLALYHCWALPGTKNTHTDASMRSVFTTLLDVIVTFFKKPGIWLAILFILLFRVGEGQIQTIGPLFLRTAKELGGLGLSTKEVGYIYGGVGTFALLGGSVLGGYFASWLGLKRALPWLILAMNVPNVVFFFLSTDRPDNLAIITAAISFEMFGYGFGFVGLILFMMQVIAVGKYQTAHYALATGVMQLGMVIPKMVSGSIQMSLGYKNFFIWVLISAIPVLLMSRLLVIKTPSPKTAQTVGTPVEA